jgi:hypothetical protein
MLSEPGEARRAAAAAWYQRGLQHLTGGATAEAGRAFVGAGRAEPGMVAAVHAALACAQRLAARGEPPLPTPAASPKRRPRLSVVICSIDAGKLASVRAHLERQLAGAPWELIHVADARALTEGYRRGIERSRGELLVLCHDDIELLCTDPYPRLVAHLERFDLIGAAGTRALSGAAWVWGGLPANDGWVAHPRPDGAWLACVYGPNGPPVPGAQALDGAFLAARRSLFERVRFDETTFDGFHFYDLDLSYRAHRAGLDVGIAQDLWLVHHSSGRFGADYARYARRFLDKFPDLPLGPRFPDPAYASAVLADRAALARAFGWLQSWHRNHEAGVAP